MSYIRVMFRGTLPGGESWSVNPAFNESLNHSTWDQTLGDNAVGVIATIPLGTALNSIKGPAAPGQMVRIERRSDSHELIGASEAPWATTGGQTADKPFQTSVVISLRTAVPSAHTRGRLYFPAISANISATTLRLETPSTQQVADGAVTWLTQIQEDLTEFLTPNPDLTFHRLCVVSQTTNLRTDVTRIQVGNVLDVQRRRRDKLVETYASAAF